jgi:hypothetical protein
VRVEQEVGVSLRRCLLFCQKNQLAFFSGGRQRQSFKAFLLKVENPHKQKKPHPLFLCACAAGNTRRSTSSGSTEEEKLPFDSYLLLKI